MTLTYQSLQDFDRQETQSRNQGKPVTECQTTWILLQQEMTEVSLVTAGATNRAKFRSNHHQQQINSQLFIDQMLFFSPNVSVSKH